MQPWHDTRQPRQNSRQPETIDLQAYRHIGRDFSEKPVKYGIDWVKFFSWSFVLAFGVSFWVCVVLVAIWVRG